MNKRETITKVSELSHVNVNDCEKVLDALEDVMKEELTKRKGIRNLFLLVYKMMSMIKNRMIMLLLMLFICASVYSQQPTQNIRGVVNDYLSGETLTSVLLSVIEYQNAQASSDNKG